MCVDQVQMPNTGTKPLQHICMHMCVLESGKCNWMGGRKTETTVKKD